MINDEQWLESLRDYENHLCEADYCRQYLKHMTRWRPIDKPPELGTWVEVLCNGLGDIHTITYGPARFKPTDLGWRPAQPLPNNGETT